MAKIKLTKSAVGAAQPEMFSRSAGLQGDDPDKPAPITESKILMPRRHADRRPDLRSSQPHAREPDPRRPVRVQRQRTPPADPPVQGIDQNIRLNRALWLMADGMQQLKA